MMASHTDTREKIAANIQFGEAILSLLTRKAECELPVIARTQPAEVVEFLQTVLHIQIVQGKLVSERLRFSMLKA
jgi:hypothetical protein